MLAPIYNAVNTLLARLTSTRANKLDSLDADISSRAPASTALSNTNWTNTRAGYLDAPISSALARSKGQEFTSSGTFSVPTGVSLVWVTMCGGGGGGGRPNSSNARGGGGGMSGLGMVRHPAVVTPGGSVTVTIGVGGAGGSANNTSGIAGGDTSFGSITAPGGAAGTTGPGGLGDYRLTGAAYDGPSAAIATGGNGGDGTYGDGGGSCNGLPGGPGGSYHNIEGGGGGGGASIFAAGGAGGNGTSGGTGVAGSAGGGYGAGGGGGGNGSTTGNGGAGGAGYCLVEWVG